MRRLGDLCARTFERYLPDPLTLALLLTLLTLAAGILAPPDLDLHATPLLPRSARVVEIWLSGVWGSGILTFALQMCIVLLAGFGLAQAPPLLRLLNRLAARPRNSRQAATLTAAVSCIGCWINWGLGLVAAGVLARQILHVLPARGQHVNRALLAAAAYSGMMIWHGGLSGSAPLKIAEQGMAGLDPIPVALTLFTLPNLALTAVLLLAVPLILRSMDSARPDDDPPVASSAEPLDFEAAVPQAIPADWLDRTRAIPWVVAVLAAAAMTLRLSRLGIRAIDINFVNTAFVAAGLLLHPHLASYVAALLRGGRAIVGIVIQFPFYGGIFAVLQHTGLAEATARAFIDLAAMANETLALPARVTFPAACLASASLLNLAIPSGGGQWAVQGPIMLDAATGLNLPPSLAVMGVAYGDQLTNMVQPFWALPLAGLTAIPPRRFLGYCAVLMFAAAPAFFVALVLW